MRNTEERREYFETFSKNEQEHWLCKDCGENTFLSEYDYYMVQNELWEKYGVNKDMLCLNCLEKRIGRKLKYDDFIKFPINEKNEFVQRLK